MLFDTDKFAQMASGSPAGCALSALVADRWSEWEGLVATAMFMFDYVGAGISIDPKQYASEIFLDALWGYGVELWHCRAAGCAKEQVRARLLSCGDSAACALKARPELIRCAANYPGRVPLEYALLGDWLETLCRTPLKSLK